MGNSRRWQRLMRWIRDKEELKEEITLSELRRKVEEIKRNAKTQTPE